LESITFSSRAAHFVARQGRHRTQPMVLSSGESLFKLSAEYNELEWKFRREHTCLVVTPRWRVCEHFVTAVLGQIVVVFTLRS